MRSGKPSETAVGATYPMYTGQLVVLVSPLAFLISGQYLKYLLLLCSPSFSLPTMISLGSSILCLTVMSMASHTNVLFQILSITYQEN